MSFGSSATSSEEDEILGIIKHIVEEKEYKIALTQSGQVYAWGDNGTGQLGLGDSGYGTDRTRPTLMTLPEGMDPIQHLAAGRDHTFALTQSGQIYAWGANYSGQLGLGDCGVDWTDHSTDRNRPTLMTLPDGMDPIQHIVVGGFHTFAVTESGQVYAWGWNGEGQLGLGDTTKRTRPTLITLPEGMDPIQHIVAGFQHNVALTQSGQVYAWGRNNCGQLGLGDSGDGTQRTRPTLITLPDGMDPIQHIFAGAFHNFALTQSGQVYAWGRNHKGQLGFGHTNNVLVPTLQPHPEKMKCDGLEELHQAQSKPEDGSRSLCASGKIVKTPVTLTSEGSSDPKTPEGGSGGESKLEDRIEERFSTMDDRISSLEGRMEERFSSLEGHISSMDDRFSSLEGLVTQLMGQVSILIKAREKERDRRMKESIDQLVARINNPSEDDSDEEVSAPQSNVGGGESKQEAPTSLPFASQLPPPDSACAPDKE